MRDLNSDNLTQYAQVLAACELVNELAQMLQMDELGMRLAYESSVLAYIPSTHVGIPSHACLVTYADGVMDGMTAAIRQGQCERVFRLTKRKGAGGIDMTLDSPRYYSVKVHGSTHPHFSRIPMIDRPGAEVGYVWTGTSNEFTPFAADPGLQAFL